MFRQEIKSLSELKADADGDGKVTKEEFMKAHEAMFAKKDADGNVYDQLTDPEIRYRQRYVDLVVNPGVKEIFRKRKRIMSTMRRIFDDAGYMEVLVFKFGTVLWLFAQAVPDKFVPYAILSG